MEFKSLNEVFDGRLALPGKNGKTYHIPEPDQELGLWCTAMMAAGWAASMGEELPDKAPPLQLDDDDETALYRRLLGPVWNELRADGYGFATQKLFAQTALIWIGLGEEQAAIHWNAGGDPKGQLPRAARRHPPAQSGSTPGTGAASTTQQAGSMSGTKRRRPPRRR
jgi:hypothetical protein